jgi:hypothetical protein
VPELVLVELDESEVAAAALRIRRGEDAFEVCAPLPQDEVCPWSGRVN